MHTIATPQALFRRVIAGVLALGLATLSLMSASAALQVSVSAYACPSADSLIASECTPLQGVSVEVSADGESSGPLTTHEDGFVYADAAPGAVVTVTMLGGGPVGYSVVTNPIVIPAMQEGSSAVFVFVPVDEPDDEPDDEIDDPPFYDDDDGDDWTEPAEEESGYVAETVAGTGGEAAPVPLVTSLPSTGSGVGHAAGTNALFLSAIAALAVLVMGGVGLLRPDVARCRK